MTLLTVLAFKTLTLPWVKADVCCKKQQKRTLKVQRCCFHKVAGPPKEPVHSPDHLASSQLNICVWMHMQCTYFSPKYKHALRSCRHYFRLKKAFIKDYSRSRVYKYLCEPGPRSSASCPEKMIWGWGSRSEGRPGLSRHLHGRGDRTRPRLKPEKNISRSGKTV